MEDEIRIDQAPRRWRLGERAIYNSANQYEVQMSPDHLVNQVIDTFLAQLLPFFADEATPDERERGAELCRFLIAELKLLLAEEKYEGILTTLTAHWHDPLDSRWIRVMNMFEAVEDERYTILEIDKGEFVADWKNNHVDAKCQVKQARKPFKQTNAQLAAVHAEAPRPSLASMLPRGVIRLTARKASGPSLRDFGTTNPRLPAVSVKKA